MKSPPVQAILDELRRVFDRTESDRLAEFAGAIRQARRVFVAGAGRSGLMMRAFAMRLMHLGFPVHVVGETTTPGIEAGDLLLVGSGSGATASMATCVARAKAEGARVGLITIRPDSPMAGTADILIAIPAPTPKLTQRTGVLSIQPMGSLFEQSLLLTLDALVILLMEETGQDAAAMFARHANLE